MDRSENGLKSDNILEKALPMKVTILGCSGGIGIVDGHHLRTTSLRVDDDILIDAGTGVGDLSLPDLAAIDHVFITHAHLDHIAALPLLLDTVGEVREGPLTVYGSAATLSQLQAHVFNWSIWPDFSQIPDATRPYLRFEVIALGQAVTIKGRTITALPAVHAVPAVGYHLDSGNASLVFTGDTTHNPALWPIVNRIANLKVLVIETAFSDQQRELAIVSKHLCPSLLAAELALFTGNADIYITHLKPGKISQTMLEIEALTVPIKPRMLQNQQTFEL